MAPRRSQRRPRRTDQRSFHDPKPAPLRIGRQHRGDERTPWNEQGPANFAHSIVLSRRLKSCARCSRAVKPIELTPSQLLRLSKGLPHDWKEQRHVPRLRRLNLHQNPGETLHIRRLENGLERPCGRSRPAPRHLASLVVADAFAGALTRGSIGTIPATAETENTRSISGRSVAEGPGFEP